MTATGRLDEAESKIKLLIEIDPLYPGGYNWLGILYYFLRRYDDAIVAYQKALELDPDYLNAIVLGFHTHIALGDYTKALKMVNRLEHRWPEGYVVDLTILKASSGKRDEAAKRKEAEKEVFSNPAFAAAYYAVIGDRDQTLANLTRIYDELPPSFRSCLLWHYCDKYRSDPGFVALFKKAGFEFKQNP